MQRSPLRHFVLHACGLALASAVSSTIFAAELGEVVVRSHIGQQLSADIELVMLTAEDAAGVPVKLAAPNVYQGANTRMHPALASMRMSVVKRDNRQFLHLTTLQPIEAEILHLFLELGTGNRASVRSATIWLTAEPAAPSRPAPARPAAPEAASGVASMMAEDAALAAQSMQAAQSAESRAVALRAARMRAAAQNALAAREAPDAGKKSGADQAAGAAAGAAPGAAAATAVKPGPAAVPIALGAEARVKRGLPSAAKAACTPGKSVDEAQQCVALDHTNAELKTKLIDLEGKVKQLQAALGQGAVAATGAATAASPAHGAGSSAPAAATASAAASSVASAPAAAAASADGAGKPVAKKKKEAGGINNTALIVGGVLLLALLSGLLAYIIRKKKFKFSTAPLKVWQGWRKDKKPAGDAAPAPVEPILSNE